MRAPSRGERIRSRPVLWAHGPTMVEHTADGEKWRGFVAAKALDGTSPIPRPLAIWDSLVAFDRKMLQQNRTRLTELYRRGEPDLFMVCSHDRPLYEQAKATA